MTTGKQFGRGVKHEGVPAQMIDKSQIKPPTQDGVKYDRGTILATREGLIKVRDVALKQAEFGSAVLLSHAVAMLGHLADNVKE